MNLKPCPFCGKDLALQSDHHGEWYQHRDCDWDCIEGQIQIHDDDDAKRWNTRSPDPETKRLRDLIEKSQLIEVDASMVDYSGSSPVIRKAGKMLVPKNQEARDRELTKALQGQATLARKLAKYEG